MRCTPATVAAVALAAGLAACTAPGHIVPGTVTGVTGLGCLGPPRAPLRPGISPATSPEEAVQRATVVAQRGSQVVATQNVHLVAGVGRYRLSLPPGRYLVTGPPSGRFRPVVLHSGETVIVNFTTTCLL